MIRGEDIRGFAIIAKEVFYYGLQLGHTAVNQTNIVQVLSRNKEKNTEWRLPFKKYGPLVSVQLSLNLKFVT